jgi:hypothetical protein
MKNLLLLIALMTGVYSVSAQGVEEYFQCVSCRSNAVNFGSYSSAIGTNNTSTGTRSFAGGFNSQATGDYSFAFGEGALSTGINSFALGKEAKAGIVNSVAIGFQSEATQPFAFAIGYRNHAHAMTSFLFGENLKTVHSGAMIIGRGTSGFLINDKNNSLMIGFNSNLPTLFVSPSSGSGTTGKIGIGNITDSEYKLHILSDVGEAAELKLEYRTTGSKQFAKIHLGDYSIRGGIDGGIQGFVFTTPSFRHFVFQNGTLRSINGSAAAPAYSFSESPGTGMFRPPSANTIAFSTGGQERVRISSSGNVGIGIENPTKKLEVAGDINLTGNIFINNQPINIQNPWTINGDQIHYAGQVAIGATSPGEYKLAVKGHIRAEEVVVQLMDRWPDYVFEADYPLMQLDELQSFISENNHLPDVPNAEQVAQQGISLGEMNALLLKKVEELTLYILKQDKRLSELETMITGKAD